MASRSRPLAGFTFGLLGRLVLLGAALTAFTATWFAAGLAATRIVSGLLAVATAAGVWRHVDRTNREVAHFIQTLRLGDRSQHFGANDGAGFNVLGEAMAAAAQAMQEARDAGIAESRVREALLDESPAALLVVDGDARVTLANKAARKLFDRLPGTRVEDFTQYGGDLVTLLGSVGEAASGLIPIRLGGAFQRATASATTLDQAGRRLRAVAVQPIQRELSAVELAAQADLVRVLTHEIMNSMTPVVSLAQSAVVLMRSLDMADPAAADARLAVETLARRAGGIMRFVEAYRDFARTPEVRRCRFAAEPWAAQLAQLFGASEPGCGVPLEIVIRPPDLLLDADPDLLAQVVINLLKNGAEAAAAQRIPELQFAIELLPGGRTRLAIGDNGPGIAPQLADEIFLPFFTTKTSGTGVGLSLARRILTAHGGSIALGVSQEGEGAVIELIL